MIGISAFKKSGRKPDPALIEGLHRTITDLARQPVFYTRFAVPDTIDGRYDLLCVMLSLFLFRVQQIDGDLAQAVFDRTFKDVERGLREAGVGDLSVPKHMKRMLAAFYGRAASYYEALDQQQTEGLAVILVRNLYNGQVAMNDATSMAEWMRIASQFLMACDGSELIANPEMVLALVPPEEN